MGPSRPNPSGEWGLRAISLSLVVVDVPASTPPLLRDLASQAPSANVTVLMKGSTKGFVMRKNTPGGGCSGRSRSRPHKPFDRRRSLSTPFHKYGNVCGWGLRGEVAKGGGGDVRDIDDDERQRDRSQPPFARRVGSRRAHLFVASPRRCLDIDSSSRLDLGSVALPTNVIVFMKVSTMLR